jgi:hypothetical protein
MEVSGQLHPQGRSTRFPLDRRLGGPQSRSRQGVEEKNSHPPPGSGPRTSDRPTRSQWLYQLSYPSSYFHHFCCLLQIRCTFISRSSYKVHKMKHIWRWCLSVCRQILFSKPIDRFLLHFVPGIYTNKSCRPHLILVHTMTIPQMESKLNFTQVLKSSPSYTK